MQEKSSRDLKKKTRVLDECVKGLIDSIGQISGTIKTIEDYEHLPDIDTIWEDVQVTKQSIDNITSNSAHLQEYISSLQKDVEYLVVFCDNLSSQVHINDVDQIWYKLKDISNVVDGHNTEIIEIKKQIDHFNTLYSDMEEDSLKIKNSLQNISDKIEEHNNSIDKIAIQVDEIKDIKSVTDRVTSQAHIYDLDQMWDKIDSNVSALNTVHEENEKYNTDIKSLKEQLSNAKATYDASLNKLNNRIKLLTVVSSVSLLLCMFVIVCSIIGVL